MNVSSIWPFAQISDDFYYLDIWQCGRYFVAALFKELALIISIKKCELSVSNFNISVSVSAFMTKFWSRSRHEI